MEWNGKKLTIVGAAGTGLTLLLSFAYGIAVGILTPENTLEDDVGIALLMAGWLVSLGVLIIGTAWWCCSWAKKELTKK